MQQQWPYMVHAVRGGGDGLGGGGESDRRFIRQVAGCPDKLKYKNTVVVETSTFCYTAANNTQRGSGVKTGVFSLAWLSPTSCSPASTSSCFPVRNFTYVPYFTLPHALIFHQIPLELWGWGVGDGMGWVGGGERELMRALSSNRHITHFAPSYVSFAFQLN